MKSLRDYFLIDPHVVFLNHGSFGAVPRAVFASYQEWQCRLESQPVQFIMHEMMGELEKARQVLGAYLNASKDDLVFVPNATFGVNILARALQLEPGDEILISDHEYGACENIWSFICQRTGATLVQQAVPMSILSPREIAQIFWQAVTPKTKLIFISHIASSTAFLMPVDIICRQARQAGIWTIIDGAHAPGQILVDLQSIDADFYVGNCHKWMLAPKGAGFLYARRELQHLVEPLVVSWGWGENSPFTTGSQYLDNLEWWGTSDPSAYLSVPAAIQFQELHDWQAVRQWCQQLLGEAIQRVSALIGRRPAHLKKETNLQMASIPLPHLRDLAAFQEQLYQQYSIEVPCIEWKEHHFIRVSIQGYNRPSDIDALLSALKDLLPQYRK